MMKGTSGGEKQAGRTRSPVLQLESSQLFRRVCVVVGCFLFVLVFLLSTRHDGAVFDTVRPKASLRAPADAETLPSSAGHVGTNGVVREAELEESNAAAAASTSDSDDRTASPGTHERADAIPQAHERETGLQFQTGGAAEPAQQDDAVHVTAAAKPAQPAMETTSPPEHELPRNTGINTRRADSVDRQPLCDLSGFRADVCDLAGDVRLVANASTFLLVVDPATGGADEPTTTHKVRPYPRKGDATAMGRVTELTVRTAESAPRCTATHAAPAVAFSAGGYAGNVFHDFTDVIVPLYSTAERYGGDVHLVVTDAGVSSPWLARYGALLRGLSRHAPLDLPAAAAAGEVHCFRRAVVGLRGHRELLIEREERGPTMPDLGRFLRRALALPRGRPTRPSDGAKPRLLLISRRGTRRLLNAAAVAHAAEEAGFEAAVRELDLGPAYDISQVGRLINSFDAVVGVHGAGLTNMVFLPPGAAVIEVVPWGGLRWIARLDFGDAAEAMGLRYVQYEVGIEESTLKDKYPRDHEVFTNPTALHRKGFTFLRHTFLNGQDIIVDVERFRPVLLQAISNLRAQE